MTVSNGAPIPFALELIVTVGVVAEFAVFEDDGTVEDDDQIKLCRTPSSTFKNSGQLLIEPTNKSLRQVRD